MGKSNIKYCSFVEYPNAIVLKEIIDLYITIFKDADIKFFKERLKQKENTLCVLAHSGDTLIGFKIGYPYNETSFYSWIGGVKSSYRQQGIATQLAEMQEEYAKENGFIKLRTKSMNQYKSMMIFNLKNGFDITKFYTNTNGQTKIVFEKLL